MPEPVILIPSGGSSMTSTGALGSSSTFTSRQIISQVVGLVPLTDCDAEECRWQQRCDWLPVFGNIEGGVPENDPSYKNDFNTFLINYPSYTTGNPAVAWYLQKATNPYLSPGVEEDWNWDDVAVLQDNTYGVIYKLGDIAAFPLYTGYAVNWAKVLDAFGEGFYRIKAAIIKVKVQIVIYGGIPVPIIDTEEEKCLASEIFKCMAWDCDRADGTVKFETSITGSVGSATEYKKVFNLCGVDWYDSIRVPGFFGYPGVPKYIETLLEHQNGQIDEINNKALRRFTYHSFYLPRWVHERFEVYGMMADTIFVSDYNINNSDYSIKRKGVRPAGNYLPNYLDPKRFQRTMLHRQRTSDVKVDFREDTESLIKSLCCPCP